MVTKMMKFSQKLCYSVTFHFVTRKIAHHLISVQNGNSNKVKSTLLPTLLLAKCLIISINTYISNKVT